MVAKPRTAAAPSAAPGAADSELDNRLKVRERLFAFGDDFWIENARDRRVYLVDGKALRVRDTLLFKDLQGQERYKLQEKVARVRDTMTLYKADGGTAATIKKALITPLRDRYTVDLPGQPELETQGNILHHEYTIEQGGDGGDDLEEVVPRPRHVQHRRRTRHDRSAPGGGHDGRHRHDARGRAEPHAAQRGNAMESTTPRVGPIQLVVIGFPPEAQFRARSCARSPTCAGGA